MNDEHMRERLKEKERQVGALMKRVDSWNTRYEIDSLKSKINELLDSIYE